MAHEVSSGAGAAPHGSPGPISGFLERFRRSGGVPATVGAAAESELVPLFAELDRLDQEAESLHRQSSAATSQCDQEAEAEIQRILIEAQSRAESIRDQTLDARRHSAGTEAAAIVVQAETDAREIVEIGEERLPGLVSEIVARVLEAER